MQFLLYKNNNIVFKSSMFEMLIEESIEGTSSIPDEYNLWQSVMEDNVEDLQLVVAELQNGKVDKIEGKGLSTNDFSTEEQTKLSNINTEVVNARTSITKNKLFADINARIEETEEDVKEINDRTGHVYGIKRLRTTTSSAWERTDDAVGLVANATFDGTAVQNDFDNLSPWKDIITYNLNKTTGNINAFYGEPNFTFDGSNGDVYTRCPDIYYKVWKDDTYKYIQIADYPKTGFLKCDSFSTMRYHAGLVDGELRSYSGLIPSFYKTLPQFRTLARAVGSNYCLLDWRYFVWQLLYLVEYANYDSQITLGKGFTSLRVSDQDKPLIAETAVNRIIVNNTVGNALIVGQQIAVGSITGANIRTITAKNSYNEGDITGTEITFDGEAKDILTTTGFWSCPQKAGSCDILGMKSGCLADDGKHDMIYRGQEGLIGNVFNFIDGINVADNQAWICYDPASYESDKFEEPYEILGYVNANANGYIKDLGLDPNHPLIQIPIEVGGASNTYVTDRYAQNTGNRVALVGGGVSDGTNAGLWYWGLNNASSFSYWSFGARLLKYQ